MATFAKVRIANLRKEWKMSVIVITPMECQYGNALGNVDLANYHLSFLADVYMSPISC